MPWFRDELVGDDVVTSKRVFFVWRRVARASSNYNAAQQDAAGIVMKLKKALAKVKAEREAFKKKAADLKKQEFNRLEEGRPYKLTRKEARERFAPYTDRPDPSWMDAINPFTLKEYGIDKGEPFGQQGHNIPNKGTPKTGRSGTTGYTLPGLEAASLHLAAELGADSVIGFKSDDGKGAAQGKGLRDKIKKENPRQEGESDKVYGERITKLVEAATKATD